MDCERHKVCRQMHNFSRLEDDGVPHDGHFTHFADLMVSVESAAARRARATFLDNPQADLFVHKFHQNKSQEQSREKTVADQLAQAFTLPPRKYKTRLERTLFSGPTPRKDAEELERSRWIHNLATMLVDTPTPIGQILKSHPTDCQYLGAGPIASTLRALYDTAKMSSAGCLRPSRRSIPLKWLILLGTSKFDVRSRAIVELFGTLADVTSFLKKLLARPMHKTCRRLKSINLWLRRS